MARHEVKEASRAPVSRPVRRVLAPAEPVDREVRAVVVIVRDAAAAAMFLAARCAASALIASAKSTTRILPEFAVTFRSEERSNRGGSLAPAPSTNDR